MSVVTDRKDRLAAERGTVKPQKLAHVGRDREPGRGDTCSKASSAPQGSSPKNL